MKKILDFIVNLFGSNLSKVICSVCEAVKSFFSYKEVKTQSKQNEKNDKKEEEFNDKIDDVTKNGTIEDLLDLKRN